MSLLVAALIMSPAPGQISAFQEEILTANSATSVLQRYCATAQIAAIRKPVRIIEPPTELRAKLRLLPGETVRHRRVRLNCSDKTFSKADNWYVPERLTANMNRQLEFSETPYGRVIAPLRAKRETLDVHTGSDMRAFVVKAMLVSADGVPLSLVIERYGLRNILTPPILPAR